MRGEGLLGRLRSNNNGAPHCIGSNGLFKATTLRRQVKEALYPTYEEGWKNPSSRRTWKEAGSEHKQIRSQGRRFRPSNIAGNTGE